MIGHLLRYPQRGCIRNTLTNRWSCEDQLLMIAEMRTWRSVAVFLGINSEMSLYGASGARCDAGHLMGIVDN